jgi:hypothetical protein
MKRSIFLSRVGLATLIAFGATILGGLALIAGEYKSGKAWPEPPVVDPGPPGGPPADAIVLFDGKDMSAWKGADAWEIKDGVVTVKGVSSTNLHYAETKQPFGDCQLHVEWAEPAEVKGSSQGRGNSGVYLMSRYEVQILDSYKNPTYYDGQCGSIYKQNPPLVNVCRKPGEWQTYDIIFEAPWFDENGKLTKPAYVTVLQNGVLVQNHFKLEGGTYWDQPAHYTAHPLKAPLQLQDHGNPVQFRNIWIRELTPPTAITEEKAAVDSSSKK